MSSIATTFGFTAGNEQPVWHAPDVSAFQRCSRDCWLRQYTPPNSFVPSLTPSSSTILPSPKTKLYQRQLKAWQTRILVLKPGKFGDDLKADLLEADIIYFEGVVLHRSQENVLYDALSYSWGHAPETHSIQCNNLDAGITQGLFFALQRLRLADRKRYLWIDALCINQSDRSEKSIQVSHMFTIFKKATKVIAWIGEKGECGHHVIDYLEGYASDTLHKFRCLHGLKAIAQGIQSLCDRPWFRRAWVRQEVFAASDLYIQCGDLSMPWSDFRSLLHQHARAIRANWAHHHLKPEDLDLSAISRTHHLRQGTPVDIAAISVYNITELSAHDEVERMSSTLRVLRKACHFQATELQDLVYGVLGMTDIAVTVRSKKRDAGLRNVQGSRTTLLVDYNRSVSQAFQDITKYVINRTQNLDIVAQAMFTTSEEMDLPGWAPNWQYLPEVTIVDRILRGQRRRYNTWLMEGHHVDALFQNEDHTGQLRVSGVVLGTLSKEDHRLTRRKAVRASAGEEDFPKRLNNLLHEPAGFQKFFLRSTTTYAISPKLKGGTPKQPTMRDVTATLSRSHVWVPNAADVHDTVVVLRGSVFPMVLRHTEDATYRLIGPLLHFRFLCDELGPDCTPQRYFTSSVQGETRFVLV